jgi:hypothetical protein
MVSGISSAWLNIEVQMGTLLYLKFNKATHTK